jgi:hypothetical protein
MSVILHPPRPRVATPRKPALAFEDLKEFRSQFEATQEEVRLQPPPVVVVVETTWLFLRRFIRLTYLSSQTVAKSRLR